jgi:hypothetical protein
MDLGVVRVGVVERDVSFERPSLTLPQGMTITQKKGEPQLLVDSRAAKKRNGFEILDLPLWLDRTISWSASRRGSNYVLNVRVVRTVSLFTLAVSLVPVLFFMRHAVSAFGNVPTAIASTVPLLGALVHESIAPFGRWRVRAVPWAVLALVPVFF